MNKKARTRKFTAKQSARLGAYLAAGLGASTAATPIADAAIVSINIGPSGFNIGGINGGVAPGSTMTINNFPFLNAGSFTLLNDAFGAQFFGLEPNQFFIAFDGGYASPRNFALNEAINNGASFTQYATQSAFRYDYSAAPNFGPGSYMGFRTWTGNYGWLEVTWDNTSNQFQILSGAYEDQVGVSILAGQGAGPAAVPEPGTWAAAALLAGGAAFARWRKRRDETQKEAA